MKMFSRLIIFTGICALFLTAAAEAGGPVVGFIQGNAQQRNFEFIQDSPYGNRVLGPEGFRYALGEQSHFFPRRPGLDSGTVYATLRNFDVMVLDTPWSTAIVIDDDSMANAAAAGDAMERYLRQGGSLLIFARATGYASSQVQEYASKMYERFGLEFLREGVWDPERSFEAPIFYNRNPEDFFYTENITKGHPVTEGVERLALPRYSYGPGVIGLGLSPEWEIIARGEESAASHPASTLVRADVDYDTTGTYASAPPIAAVREYGRGRLMVYSLPPIHAHYNYGVPGWNMIVEETGWEEKNLPSHSGRMVLNGIRWLAETGERAQNIGIFDFKAFDFSPVSYPDYVHFDGRDFDEPVKEGLKGIFGARTALSDGEGTIEDYVLAAKKAGLSFIVFTEALEHLSKDDFEFLKSECRRLSDDEFYASPGIEFYDNMANRWVLWAERLQYPDSRVNMPGFDEPFVQWDGERVNFLGSFLGQARRAPAALLTYSHLRESGGHPHNMWWFFRVAPFVYEDGELIEENLDEFFYALRDIKRVQPISYYRITSPDEVGLSAANMVTVARDMESLRAWLNTTAGNHNKPAANPYIADRGGRVNIEQWSGVNYQMPYHYMDVRGVQRARLRFQVSSEAGIDEVRVRCASRGVVRRFDGGGKNTFAREFELVHDRDQYLVLEVEDSDGAFALSSAINIWCYKTSIFRCGDNHNLLNGRWLVWHSCYDQMMDFDTGGGFLNSKWEGEALSGFDTAAPLRKHSTFYLRHTRDRSAWEMPVNTEEMGGPYPRRIEHGGMQRKVMDIPLPGRDPVIVEMDIGDMVTRTGIPERPRAVRSNLPVREAENELFERTHRAYYFQNRTNMFTVWDHRRRGEGTAPCRGNVVWHEGEITFKRDAVLAGDIPIKLAYGDIDDELQTHVIAKGPEGYSSEPIEDGRTGKTGALAPGGWVTVVPNNVFTAFYAPEEEGFKYKIFTGRSGRPNSIAVGIGEAGRQVKEGETIRYRFAAVTSGSAEFKDVREYIERLDFMGRSLGLGGSGIEAAVLKGREEGREMFYSLSAEGGEVVVDVRPREVIIALPFRVDGVEDNGAAAVWSSSRPWFRFAGVEGGRLYFQEDIDQGAEIWAGNVFLSSNRDLSLTLVADGIKEGRRPYMEIHNPTGHDITADIHSPENTPVFGGMIMEDVRVPAGDSVFAEFPSSGGSPVFMSEVPEAPESRPRRVERPDFFSRVRRDDGYALRVSVKEIEEGRIFPWQSGAAAGLAESIDASADEPARIRVGFEGRSVEGAREIVICRPWGGSSRESVVLGSEWRSYSVELSLSAASSGIFFTPVDGRHMKEAVFEMDNITVEILDGSGQPVSENLVKNGDFSDGVEGWTGYTRVWEIDAG